jgi:hypothetical protein
LFQLGKTLTLTDSFHTSNSDSYRKEFLQCEDQQKRLKKAQKQLDAQLLNSAGDVPYPNVRGAVIIYLHDFFDSPHIYPDLIFPDFWNWICFTIEILQSSKIPFFLKRHPNQLALSDDICLRLSNKYNDASFLPNGLTIQQLAAADIACVVTMYGTVVHEAAYLGVPSIACARHPSAAFDFCNTAKTLIEYEALLRKANALVLNDKQIVKQQVLEFYVMHYLRLPSEQLEAGAHLMDLWRISHSSQSSGQEIAESLFALADDEGFRKFARSLLQ